MPHWALREKLLYFALVPAIVLAVLVLGVYSLRTTGQIERARRQTVVDATLTLADERVDSLDKLIVAQDNVVAMHADPASLSAIPRRWLPTAARETPSVRAILVLDMDHDEHEVLSFVSRRPGPEDDAFRRALVTRLFPQINRSGSRRRAPPPAPHAGRGEPAHQLLAAPARGPALPRRGVAQPADLGPRRDAAALPRHRPRPEPHERGRRGGARRLRPPHQGR